MNDNGSSQGLFVVVAVVIFGIFVAISYSLFRDQLTPSLASMFSESTMKSTEELIPFIDIKEVSVVNAKLSKDGYNSYTVYDIKEASYTSDGYPTGVRINEILEIPWGYKIVFHYEIYIDSPSKVVVSTDFNAYPNKTSSTGSWHVNDNYGSTGFRDFKGQYNTATLPPKTWKKVDVYYVNISIKNEKELPLYDGVSYGSKGSVFGIQNDQLNKLGITTFKIRNLQYKIVKI